MDANDWNGLLAGIVSIAIGLLALAGFAWNIRRGVAAYTSAIRAHLERIGNPYADDERGILALAVAKLSGTAGIGIILLIGGALLIAMAVHP